MIEKIPYTIGTSSRSCSTTIIPRHPNPWGILFIFFYWQKKKLKKMLQIVATYWNIKSRHTVQYKKKSWSTVLSNIQVLKNLSFISQSFNQMSLFHFRTNQPRKVVSAFGFSFCSAFGSDVENHFMKFLTLFLEVQRQKEKKHVSVFSNIKKSSTFL